MSREKGNCYQGYKWCHPPTRWAIYWRDRDPATHRFRCVWCLRTGLELTLDHLTPHRRGGTHHPTNLITSCRRCNELRRASDWEDRAEGCNWDPEVEARVEGLRRAPLERARGRFLSEMFRWMRAKDPGRYGRMFGQHCNPLEPDPDWFRPDEYVPF